MNIMDTAVEIASFLDEENIPLPLLAD